MRTLFESIFDQDDNDGELFIDSIMLRPDEGAAGNFLRIVPLFTKYGWKRPVRFSSVKPFIIVYVSYGKVSIQLINPKDRMMYRIDQGGRGRNFDVLRIHDQQIIKMKHTHALRDGYPIFSPVARKDGLFQDIVKYIEKNADENPI